MKLAFEKISEDNYILKQCHELDNKIKDLVQSLNMNIENKFLDVSSLYLEKQILSRIVVSYFINDIGISNIMGYTLITYNYNGENIEITAGTISEGDKVYYLNGILNPT